jgi:hypothetical protein
MQSRFTKFALAALALASVSFSACKKDEVRATLTPSNNPTLTSTTNAVVLTQANASQTAATYTWTPVKSLDWANAENTYKPAITYYLQIDKKGNNFGAPVSIIAGAGPTTTLTVGDLNTSLGTLGVTAGTATDLEVRLNASYASNSTTVSNALPLKATTYDFCAQPASSKAWAIIGQAAKGWGDTDDVAMTYDCASQSYTYTGPFKADEFKFRYGGNDATTGKWKADLGGVSSTGGPLTPGGPNLKIAAAGTYTVVLKPGPLTADGKATGGSYTIK